MRSSLFSLSIKALLLFSFYLLLIPIIACGEGLTGGGSVGTPASSVSGTNPVAAPSAPPNDTNTTTVASAAPTAQPTYPSIPSQNYIIQIQLKSPAKNSKTDCFDTYPTVQVWTKENGNWVFDHEIQKPQADSDPTWTNNYLCGNFSTNFPWLLSPPDEPCFNTFEGKFVAIYKNSNRITFKGESRVYTCRDGVNYPAATIDLEAQPLPMMMNPNNAGLLINP